MSPVSAHGARFESLVWVSCFGLLLFGIGYETEWGERLVWPVALPEMPPAVASSPVLFQSYVLPPPDTFIETSLRPVFVSTRRPAPVRPPEPPKPVSVMKKGQFILSGTTLVEGKKFAHLIEVSGSKARTITEGVEINGILVKEISPHGVLLTQGDESEHLTLRKPQR
jgi:hypothetical protein